MAAVMEQGKRRSMTLLPTRETLIVRDCPGLPSFGLSFSAGEATHIIVRSCRSLSASNPPFPYLLDSQSAKTQTHPFLDPEIVILCSPSLPLQSPSHIAVNLYRLESIFISPKQRTNTQTKPIRNKLLTCVFNPAAAKDSLLFSRLYPSHPEHKPASRIEPRRGSLHITVNATLGQGTYNPIHSILDSRLSSPAPTSSTATVFDLDRPAACILRFRHRHGYRKSIRIQSLASLIRASTTVARQPHLAINEHTVRPVLHPIQ
ncbi:hypothetical protein GE09DRAFT_62554 [Coniochaeta sp. 2T2.1]|nr:hypothetical protein GE09DRAFT_62554 [Coniochaeta sp. 2T2.1]